VLEINSAARNTQLGQKAISAAKEVGLRAATRGINVAKDVAKEKKVLAVPNVVPTISQESVQTLQQLAAPVKPTSHTSLTQDSLSTLNSLTNPQGLNGKGVVSLAAKSIKNAILIQDLVKKLQGSGLKVAH
jgi:hypothetical protein